jgi:uncharacterized membrane protein YcaP (DUF421 family)
MESVFKPLAIYLFLLLIFRAAGKRTLAETTPFDLVLLLIISEVTQQAMSGEDYSLTNAAVLISTLVGTDLAVGAMKRRWPRASRVIEGLPVVVVKDGRVLEERLKGSRMDRDEIMEAVRDHGLESLDDVKYAVLEPSGEISIVPRRRGAGIAAD